MYQNNCPSCAVYTTAFFSTFFDNFSVVLKHFDNCLLVEHSWSVHHLWKNSDSKTTPIASLNKQQKSKYSTRYKEITKHWHFVGVYIIHKTCSLDLKHKTEILYVPLATEIVLSLRFKLKELLAIIPILCTTAQVTLWCWGATAVHFNANTLSKFTIYQWVTSQIKRNHIQRMQTKASWYECGRKKMHKVNEKELKLHAIETVCLFYLKIQLNAQVIFISMRNEFWYAFSNIYPSEADKFLCISFFRVERTQKRVPTNPHLNDIFQTKRASFLWRNIELNPELF